jgi:hypothetical protein
MITMPGIVASSIGRGTSIPTYIRTIDIDVDTIQRQGEPFVVNSTVVGTGNYLWRVFDLSTNNSIASSTDPTPIFTISTEGEYLIYLTVTGLNQVKRVFWKNKITVLPVTFTEGEADRVLTCGTGNNLFDGSTWGNGEKIFVKRSGATIGKLRFSNLNPSVRSHILIDPANRMEARSFSGGHGLQFINCSNLLFDGCGNPAQDYNFYCNANGLSTSHAVSIGESNGVPCTNMHLCGIETNTPTSGASGFRYLADETPTYNRNTTEIHNFKLHNWKVTNSGHEGVYVGFNSDTDTGDGGPPQFYNTRIYHGWIVDSGRDGLQPCNCVENLLIHDIRIDSAATLGEPSHASYVSVNPGNSGHIFNIKGLGGVQAISQQFGDTGGEMWIWNCVFECNNVSGSSQTFIQVGDAPNTNLHYWNWTEWGLQDTKIGYRLDSTLTQGTQDIVVFHLINQVTKKGTSSNFLTVDGTNSQTQWVTNQGNLTYVIATQATADLDPDYQPLTSSSPVINGGVDISTYIPYSDFFGSFDSGTHELTYDIDGYVVTGGDYFSGAYSGIELKLADLV